MFVRLLFLLLLALNLGAGAWLLFGHVRATPVAPATDSGVPELRLWSETARELPPTSASRGLPSPAQSVAATVSAPVGETCNSLGPFTTRADMSAAMQALSPHVARIQYRAEPVRRSHGYWVFLPATDSREAALDAARRLAAKGINDYYVVTAGDTQNTISLGLFNDEANADKRLKLVEAQGFPAKVEQRIDTETAYWLDYVVPGTRAFDWSAWLPNRNDLQSKPIDCF